MKARRKPCFDALSFDEIADNTDLGECMESRYYSGSEPDCSVLCNGGSWKTCKQGKMNHQYKEWRWRYEDTVQCSKCHGTGRVKR